MRRWRFFLAQVLWAIAVIFAVEMNLTDPGAVLALAGVMFLVSGVLMQWGGIREQMVEKDRSNTVARTLATTFMWLIYVGATMAGVEEVGPLMIPLSIILMVPLLAMSAFMWDIPGKTRFSQYTAQTEEAEKRKRDRLDAVLRDLSDDELLRLKQRLSSGTVDDDHLQYLLGDDGELMVVEK